MPGALLTDLYELNMAASYLRRNMTAPATFSLYVRDMPANRGFLVAAGLDDCLDYLQGLSFADDDLVYLETLGFTSADIDAFAKLRFTGEVWAVPEGTLVLAGEPILEVTAPIPEAQLVETFLLNQVAFQTAIASKAARCMLAAGDAALVDFGFRRAHGLDAGLALARVTAMVGFAATSNVEAARRFGLTAAGTMAHSYIEAFRSEEDAFVAFAEDFPGRTTFLVDTYDTIEGVERAAAVIRQLGLSGDLGVRLDSGDLGALAQAARARLDGMGLGEVRIFASGGLDEFVIARLRHEGAPIDAYGVGTQVSVAADAPAVEAVYKLVEYDGRPTLKLSTDKATAPGAKQVFRAPGFADDMIAGRQEQPPTIAHEALLVQVMRGGRHIGGREPIADIRGRVQAGLATLPPAARSIQASVPPTARFSPEVERVAADLRAAPG